MKVQLMSCTPEKGVMVLKLHSKMEAGVTESSVTPIRR